MGRMKGLRGFAGESRCRFVGALLAGRRRGEASFFKSSSKKEGGEKEIELGKQTGKRRERREEGQGDGKGYNNKMTDGLGIISVN